MKVRFWVDAYRRGSKEEDYIKERLNSLGLDYDTIIGSGEYGLPCIEIDKCLYWGRALFLGFQALEAKSK